MTNAASTRRHRESGAEQLTLLPTSHAHARFRLSRATRERGLRHIAEIRQQLAERDAARESDTVRALPPRHHPEAA